MAEPEEAPATEDPEEAMPEAPEKPTPKASIRYVQDGKPITPDDIKEGLVKAKNEVVETIAEPIMDLVDLYTRRSKQAFRGFVKGLAGKEDGE